MPIETRVDGGIAEITLAVNKVNALDIASTLALAEAIERAGKRQDVKVVILRNEGSGFCVGADVKQINNDPAGIHHSHEAWGRLSAACHLCEIPVIAAVDGHCIGGGVVIAASCDVIFMSERTTVSMPPIKLGSWGGSTFLVRLVGPLKARASMMTGRTLTAAQVAEGGAIEAVLPSEHLRDAVMALARDIAQKSREALRMGKMALNAIEPMDLEHLYRFEQGITTNLFVTPEARAIRDARIAAGFKDK